MLLRNGSALYGPTDYGGALMPRSRAPPEAVPLAPPSPPPKWRRGGSGGRSRPRDEGEKCLTSAGQAVVGAWGGGNRGRCRPAAGPRGQEGCQPSHLRGGNPIGAGLREAAVAPSPAGGRSPLLVPWRAQPLPRDPPLRGSGRRSRHRPAVIRRHGRAADCEGSVFCCVVTRRGRGGCGGGGEGGRRWPLAGPSPQAPALRCIGVCCVKRTHIIGLVVGRRGPVLPGPPPDSQRAPLKPPPPPPLPRPPGRPCCVF